MKFGKQSGFMNKLSWGKTKELDDDVHILIYEETEKGDVIVDEGKGCWLSHIRFIGEYSWRIHDRHPEWELIGDCPSSIGDREDLKLIK